MRTGPVTILLLVVAAACSGDPSGVDAGDGVTCGQLECDEGLVCHPTFEHDACVSPDQLYACAGQPDELLCELDPFPRAWCIDGLCRPAWCGDGRIGPTETCEESWANPDSCVDYRGYDYGRLECDSLLCRADFRECEYLGWRAGTAGEIGTIWSIAPHDWYATDQMLATLLVDNDLAYIGDAGATDVHVWWQGVWSSLDWVVAVGFGYPGGDAPVEDAFIVWSAGGWQQVQLPDRRLRAVWGRSPSDVYAVGAVVDPSMPFPDDEVAGFALHFDGVDWTPMTLPAGVGPLEGVWADATRAFAVGADGTILSLEGGTWVRAASPIDDAVAPEPDPRLHAVWGRADADVFAVGEAGTVLRLDATGWRVMPTPTTATLESAGGWLLGPTHAVGEAGTILHFDGHLWGQVYTDETDTLHAIWEGLAGAGPGETLAYQNAGFARLLDPSASIDVLAGVGVPEDTGRSVPVYVVGAGGCAIHEATVEGWTSQPFPSCMPCDATPVAAWATVSEAFVIAAEGHVLHKRDGVWGCDALPAPPVPERLAGIWGSTPDDVFVVGAAADGSAVRVLHYDGVAWADWSDQVAPHATALSDVWGAGPTDVWAVGAGGAIVHYDGAQWTAVASGTDAALLAIDGSSPDHVVAVGAGGTVVRYGGASWSPMASRTGEDLREVVAVETADIYAATAASLHHFDGFAWAPVRLPASATVDDAWGIRGGLFLASEATGLLRLDGVLWP